MLKGVLNKGFVKYSAILALLFVCIVFVSFMQTGEGRGIPEIGVETGVTESCDPPEIMDFKEITEGKDAPPEEPETPPEEENNEEGSGSKSSGFFILTGGSGPAAAPMCQPIDYYNKCDYAQQACIEVVGDLSDECSNFNDCIHTECDYDEEVCETIDSKGNDDCEIDDDCVCEPPYLAVDKEANPTELICDEETTITLTVSGEGEACKDYYPVDVVLVFDRSGSMDDDGQNPPQPLTDAKDAAKMFVNLLGNNDKSGLVSFATTANLDESLTFVHQDVKDELDSMTAGGWTNMSDALELANEELITEGRVDVPWIEILLSDGNNNCGYNLNFSNPQEVEECHQKVFDRTQEAVDNGIVIYTIALGDNANQTMMQDIADMTGGSFYYAPTSDDLEEIYEEIAEDVNTIAGTDVMVYDYLPAYVELNESTLPVDCEYNASERLITCDVGTVNINETFEYSFNVFLHITGTNLTNVYPDSGVFYKDYEGVDPFVPFPETYVTVVCNYHACEGMACVEMPGFGQDSCSDDSDCTDYVCNYDDLTCDAVEGTGVVGCTTFEEDCPHHKECDYVEQACSIVEGEDSDECSTYDECFHDICNYQSLTCEEVPKDVTGDSCSVNEDCYHLICDYSSFTCEERPTYEQGDSCAVDTDCFDKICDYDLDVCKQVEPGTSGDACSDWYPDCFHDICDYQTLTCDKFPNDVTGDSCSVDGDCFHYICDYSSFTCEQRPTTEQGDICTKDTDCYDKVCNYDQNICEEVEPGTAGKACSDWYPDCFHDICNYNDMICEKVPDNIQGDACTYDENCYQYICNYDSLTCDKVPSTTSGDSCSVDENCYQYICDYSSFTCEQRPIYEQGDSCSLDTDCFDKICDYDLDVCKQVGSGTPGDACNTWEDCYYCGNGVLDPGEECEISGPYAGWGPWTHQYTCHENNTYYECNATCEYEHRNECVYYCSGDLECDGHPPMTYLDTCTSFGYAYLQDYCNEVCELEDNNCEDDYSGCTSDPECDELVPGTGDCNYMCEYKPLRMVCDYEQLTCREDPSSGSDECSSFEQCPQHNVCDHGLKQCRVEEGEDTDECGTYDECVHDICDYSTFTCEERPTTEQGDLCSEDTDCFQMICNYNSETCEKDHPAITGAVSCSDYSDCIHKICNYQTLICEEEPVYVTGDLCVVDSDCGECTDDDDCNHLDDDYCQGNKIMHVEGVCINNACEAGTPTEVQDCYYTLDSCKGTEMWTETGYCEPSTVTCESYDTFVEDCYYYETYCEGDDRWEGTGFCNGNGVFCDSSQNFIEDCTDDLWCNGQEICQEAVGIGGYRYSTCVGGMSIDCGIYNLPEIAECTYDPDNIPYTWDYAAPFTSMCIEDVQNIGHCTDGTQELTHVCDVDRCGAECDSDDDCDCPSDYCRGIDGTTLLDYPDFNECSDCSCGDCEPEYIGCHPDCMDGCEVEFSTIHKNDDIHIIARDVSEGGNKCDGKRITVVYWWCQCDEVTWSENLQVAIETTKKGVNGWPAWDPKSDRLCTGDGVDHYDNPTHPLECADCEKRNQDFTFPQHDYGKTGYSFPTGSGSKGGTFQIDLRKDWECYDIITPGALACAHSNLDKPFHTYCSDTEQACVWKWGSGSRLCIKDSDCPEPVIPTYLACDGTACVEKTGEPGSGDISCTAVGNNCPECIDYVCQDMSCVQVPGSGNVGCFSDGNCYHNECIDPYMCEPVPGPGPDLCYKDLNCGPPEEPRI